MAPPRSFAAVALTAALTAALAVAAACGDDEAARPDASAPSARDGSAPASDAAQPDASALGDADAPAPDAAEARLDAGAGDAAAVDAGPAPTFTLSGRVTYDWVPAASEAEGGPRLDYARASARPARRVRVSAIEGSAAVATAHTDDAGRFVLDVPRGHTVAVRVDAHSTSTGAVPDGIAPDACRGARWDAEVVDNTRGRAPYTLTGDGRYADSASDLALHAALVRQQGVTFRRSAAPFALLDTVVSMFELVCTAEPAVQLPRLVLNWSANNRPVSGDLAMGEIGTSFHRGGANASNIYILGQEDVDTDEYDDHVIAHETGHYLDEWIYRSDSGGGDHLDRDVLEPAVAFSEGWCNALSAMVLGDPTYVDTRGPGQEGGFDSDISAAPRGDDRGIYSENSAQYLVWQLFDRRDPTPVTGRFDRLHDAFRRGQRDTLALTSMLSFAAYYHGQHGPLAEDLRTLWATDLDTPYDALCLGRCVGVGDPADPFDTDDDVGPHYATASPRHYPDVMGTTWPREFWRVFAPLVPGQNAATAHDQTNFGNYDEFDNKWGDNRYYRYQATRTGSADVEVQSGACGEDVLDLYAYRAGALLDQDESTSGCPHVTFPVRAGETYVVQVQGLTREIGAWVTTVSEQKRGGVARAQLRALGPMRAGGAAEVALTVTRARREGRPLRVRLRGLDGVEVPAAAREPRPLPASGDVRIEVTVPRENAGLLVADVLVGDRTVTTAALRVGAPGAPWVRHDVGTLDYGVIHLP